MSKSTATIFGSRLRSARQRAGIPQDKLGVMMGIDEGASSARISRYETGEHEPKFALAQQLAKKLKVPVAYFYCDDDTIAELLLSVAGLSKAQIASLASSAKSLKDKPK